MDPGIVLPAVAGIGIGFVVAPAIAIGAIGAGKPVPVICPENGQVADVRVELKRSIGVMFTGGCQRVAECSRWPERAGCGRECASSIRV